MKFNFTKEFYWATGAIIVILIVGGIFLFGVHNKNNSVQPATQGKSIGYGQYYNGSSTKTDVPANAVAPGVNATNVPAGVAKPQSIVQAGPSTSNKLRAFNIVINGNAYNLDSIIVNQWDTIDINFMAVDKDYDFTQPDYGLHMDIAKGQTKLAEFQATQPGKFTFFCLSCGGPAKGPVGYLTVVPKK